MKGGAAAMDDEVYQEEDCFRELYPAAGDWYWRIRCKG
jgi:hypothetical protein